MDHRTLVLGLLLGLRSAFHSIADAAKYNERKEGHSPLLIWLEGLVKRCASLHKGDRVTVAQGFHVDHCHAIRVSVLPVAELLGALL